MKIAICYSGLVRSFEKTFDNHKRALINFNNAEADIFAHFWEPKSESKRWILDNVQHEKVIFENSKDEEFKEEAEGNAAFAEWVTKAYKALSMFYGVEKSINLALEYERANSFKYDFIVRMRTDLFFLYNSLSKLEKHDNSKLTISPGRMIYGRRRVHWAATDAAIFASELEEAHAREESSRSDPNPCPESIDDMFAFGSGEVMKKYLVYSDHGEIIKERLPNSPECLLGIHVKNNGLDVYENAWQLGLFKGGEWSQTDDGSYSFRGGFKSKLI
jgi:hypothetical protein